MHLIEKWQILGSEITDNIRNAYGCPDSEVGGLKIKKWSGKGKNHREQFGFSVKEWCQYIMRQGSWCDEIFINLIASMWECRISVLRVDNLCEVTYRYEGSYDKANIILMFNGNPMKGHYSLVSHSGKNLEFKSNEVEPISFSLNYRKTVDLDECLNQLDSLWDLDDEKAQRCIFN